MPVADAAHPTTAEPVRLQVLRALCPRSTDTPLDTATHVQHVLDAGTALNIHWQDASGTGPCTAAVYVCEPGTLPQACEALHALRQQSPCTPALILTDELAAPPLQELLARGAADFCSPTCSDNELLLRLQRLLGTAQPLSGSSGSPPPLLKQRLVGLSPSFVRLVQRVPTLAQNEASILLLGETGTGKEVFAQAIHYCSRRAHGPWVAVNCAAIPPDLVENEFFGHVRGAYTHAVDARRGLVQEAEGGTLFLDEVDALPLGSQAKLLRFLEERRYRAVGASQSHAANLRIIAASNRDLRADAEAGRFRQDLYFRLAVLSLALPPLRERREDIGALTVHFLSQINAETGRLIGPPTAEALSRLCAHHWPGNIRELRHVILRAVLMTTHTRLQAQDIDFDDGRFCDAAPPLGFREAKAQAVESFERHYLEALLVRSGGNISRAAREAHKNRRAFFELLRRRAIDPERYRSGSAGQMPGPSAG